MSALITDQRMPFYEYECQHCKFFIRGIAEDLRSAAAASARRADASAEAARLRAGVPPEGQRLVRDRLQVRQGKQAQPAEKGDKEESKAEAKQDSAGAAEGDGKADAKAAAKPDAKADRAKADSARPIPKGRFAASVAAEPTGSGTRPRTGRSATTAAKSKSNGRTKPARRAPAARQRRR